MDSGLSAASSTSSAVRPAQGSLQPPPPLEPQGRLQPHRRRVRRMQRAAGPADHGRHAPHGGQPAQRGAVSRRIKSTNGGLNFRLHTVTDGKGRPIIALPYEARMSGHKGAALMLSALPPARALTGGRGYHSNSFRQDLTTCGIEPCIPPRYGRKSRILHGRKLYRQRERIEADAGRLKDWRRVATRQDRCALPPCPPFASPPPSSSESMGPEPRAQATSSSARSDAIMDVRIRYSLCRAGSSAVARSSSSEARRTAGSRWFSVARLRSACCCTTSRATF